MGKIRYLFLAGLAAGWGAVLAGCSDEYGGRKQVTGNVTIKGQAIKEGIITFIPLDGQGTESGAPILNGKYKVPRNQGLKAGKYLVRMTAGDGKSPDADAEAGAPGGSTNIVSVDLVPDDWSVKTKQQVEVKESGANNFDFSIPDYNPKAKKK